MWKMYESISIYFEEFFISNFETFLWWLLYVFLNLTNHSGSILCFLILIADPAAILQNWPEDFNGSYFIWSLGNMQFWNKFQCIFIIFSWFHLDNFLFWKNRGILRIFFFDTICPRIHKNGPTCKLCTILEWDKCQQFADFIKFVVFWFALTQSCKTFVSFFMDQTLCILFTLFILETYS